MMMKFVARNGEIFRVLHQLDEVVWLISCDNPTEQPFCVMDAELHNFQRVPAPQGFVLEEPDRFTLSPAAQKRLELIQPLLEQDSAVITNRKLRNSIARDTARKYETTPRRIIHLYYRWPSILGVVNPLLV